MGTLAARLRACRPATIRQCRIPDPHKHKRLVAYRVRIALIRQSPRLREAESVDGGRRHRSVLRAVRYLQRDDKPDIKSQRDCRDKNDDRFAHLRLPVAPHKRPDPIQGSQRYAAGNGRAGPQGA